MQALYCFRKPKPQIIMSKTKKGNAKKDVEKQPSTKSLKKSTTINKSVDAKSTSTNKIVDVAEKPTKTKVTAEKQEKPNYKKRVLMQLDKFKNTPHTNLAVVLNGVIL